MESNGEIVVYQSKDGSIELAVKLESDDVWLTQQQIAKLFNKSSQNIVIHLGNVYKEGELDKSSTCKESLQVQNEGGRSVSRKVSFYNLDPICGKNKFQRNCCQGLTPKRNRHYFREI